MAINIWHCTLTSEISKKMFFSIDVNFHFHSEWMWPKHSLYLWLHKTRPFSVNSKCNYLWPHRSQIFIAFKSFFSISSVIQTNPCWLEPQKKKMLNLFLSKWVYQWELKYHTEVCRDWNKNRKAKPPKPSAEFQMPSQVWIAITHFKTSRKSVQGRHVRRTLLWVKKVFLGRSSSPNIEINAKTTTVIAGYCIDLKINSCLTVVYLKVHFSQCILAMSKSWFSELKVNDLPKMFFKALVNMGLNVGKIALIKLQLISQHNLSIIICWKKQRFRD